jgi:hypothetical protein
VAGETEELEEIPPQCPLDEKDKARKELKWKQLEAM